MKSYYQVTEKTVNEIIVKKSKFITTLIPITDSEDAEKQLKSIKKQYSDATHNCYCYIANTIATVQRFSDDGEPQGTAGIPMLEVLKKREIYLTLAVVTRYFGGVKLGASGLVSAYTDSIVQAINKAKLQKFVFSNISELTVDYNAYTHCVEIIKSLGGSILDIEYGSEVQLKFTIDTNVYDVAVAKLTDYCLGKIKLTILEKKYIGYDI